MFLNKLVGRTNPLEDALHKLENVSLEESRMTGAVALKTIYSVENKVCDNVHVVQDALQAVNDKVGGVEDMLQTIVEKLPWMLQGDRNEKLGRQTENHFDTVTEKGPEGVCEKLEAVDHVDKVPSAVKDIGSKSIAGDGAQLFSNRSSTPSPSVFRS